MTTRDEYVEKMKIQLDELNAKITTIEDAAHDAKTEARDKYRAEVRKLRHQSKLAVGKLEEMKAAGEESWEGLVTEMEKVRDAFVHSFHYFQSQV